ncbi:MAG: GIY-YIG nuclease family protein [Elusimicrobiota bacterium]
MIRKIKNTGEKDWSVYILRCGDGSLYTGIAKDVEARIRSHNAGKGAAYTRTHRPVELVFHEALFTRSEALIREARIKRYPRAKKEKLIEKL